MTVRRVALAACAAALLAVWPAAAASAAEDQALDITEVDTSAHPTVALTVQAPPALRGAELSPGSVTVTEDGQKRAADLRRLPGEELQVVLVLDTSGSMQGEAMAAAKLAATRFVDQMPDGVRVAVVGFGSTSRVATAFTDDRPALVAAVDGLTASGRTALYDAVLEAIRLFPADAQSRRSLVVLSDGGDTASSRTLDDAATALAASGVRSDVVQLASVESDQASLARLAEAGRGSLVQASDPTALGAAYDELAAELSSEYVLTYRSAAGGTTELRVVLETEAVRAEATRSLSLPALPAATAPEVLPAPGTSWQLVAGAGAVFLSILALAGTALTGSRRVAVSLPGSRAVTSGRLSGLSSQAEAAVERAISSERRGALNRSLERAGLSLRPAELVVLVACVAFSALALGLLLGGPVLGLLLAGVVLLAVRPVLRSLATRRRAQFTAQLGETLQLLAGSLRSGYALQQAVDAVARESESPTSEEFRRLTTEVRLGRDFRGALDALAARVGDEDFDWVVQAVAINREVGGDLSEVLDRVAETIRERNRLRRQVKALSAEGRLSAVVLFSLPICLVGFISVANPGYLGPLVSTALGLGMTVVATILMGVGGLWLRHVVRPVF